MEGDSIDLQALRERYRQEREKRLRDDGNDQYLDPERILPAVVGGAAAFEPRRTRPARDRDVDVLVIGGGLGGLLAGARLRQAGVEQICIVEKGADFGGTWFWNRYPGARCDVESYVYMPLLEETGYMPSERYASAVEIFEHCRRIGQHFDLRRAALFGTAVIEARWHESSSRWIVSTDHGDRIRARFLCMANGPLDRPKLPGVPGIQRFRGVSFHTSRWDYRYTGGGPDGGLTGLHGRRVGLIGTGASAVQCVPHLAAHARRLVVFQRTPSPVGERNNRATDAEWASTLESGWQRARIENFTRVMSGTFETVDLVADGWTEIVERRVLTALVERRHAAGETPGGVAAAVERADAETMAALRRRVDAVVDDPATAEALKAWYRPFCKRPCFHDEYLQSFNRPNVTLVDTAGHGVDCVTESGVVANGSEYELDCIVYATGFAVGAPHEQRAGYRTIGRDGLTLTEAWAHGAQTFHGMHVHGFPNCFFFGPVQSGRTLNYPHMLDEQATHVAHIVAHAIVEGVDTVEATKDAQERWTATIRALGGRDLAFLEACTPSYLNHEGRPVERSVLDSHYGRGAVEFFEVLRAWRHDGTFEGLDLQHVTRSFARINPASSRLR